MYNTHTHTHTHTHNAQVSGVSLRHTNPFDTAAVQHTIGSGAQMSIHKLDVHVRLSADCASPIATQRRPILEDQVRYTFDKDIKPVYLESSRHKH